MLRASLFFSALGERLCSQLLCPPLGSAALLTPGGSPSQLDRRPVTFHPRSPPSVSLGPLKAAESIQLADGEPLLPKIFQVAPFRPQCFWPLDLPAGNVQALEQISRSCQQDVGCVHHQTPMGPLSGSCWRALWLGQNTS